MMVVRIGGIPMFTEYVSHNRMVVVELGGTSDEVMTSNRDGLVSPFSGELSSFVTELAVDKKSALKSRGPRYVRFAGDRLSHCKVADNVVNVADLVRDTPVASPDADDSLELSEGVTIGVGTASPPSSSERVVARGVHAAAYSGASPAPAERVVTLGTEFILKNETDLVIPAYYRPDTSEFSTYSRKLIRIWGRLMLEMHRCFDVEAEFAVGFVFDDGGTEAEHEEGNYGKVYYISPAKVVEQNYTYSKSFSKRFKLTERNRLIALALHEFVHGIGYSWHDERYAGKLTDLMGKVMDSRKRFNWCFK
jgi:hypothetical protein